MWLWTVFREYVKEDQDMRYYVEGNRDRDRFPSVLDLLENATKQKFDSDADLLLFPTAADKIIDSKSLEIITDPTRETIVAKISDTYVLLKVRKKKKRKNKKKKILRFHFFIFQIFL